MSAGVTSKRRTRHRGRFRPETLELLDRVREVLEQLREYHPLTLRQVYYRFVARLVIPNKLESYKKLSPVELEQIVRDAIEARVDMAMFEAEREAEQAEPGRIAQLRVDVSRFVDGGVEL